MFLNLEWPAIAGLVLLVLHVAVTSFCVRAFVLPRGVFTGQGNVPPLNGSHLCHHNLPLTIGGASNHVNLLLTKLNEGTAQSTNRVLFGAVTTAHRDAKFVKRASYALDGS